MIAFIMKVLTTIFAIVMTLVCGYELLDVLRGLRKKVTITNVIFTFIFTALLIGIILEIIVTWC